MESESSIFNEFAQTYDARENMRLQQAEPTVLTADLYNAAIDAATTRLTELASNPEVHEYLSRLGGAVVRGLVELKEIEESGLVEPKVVEVKRQEIDRLQADPQVRMAVEFLAPERLPHVKSSRVVRFASPAQIEYGKVLGLEITEDVTKGQASSMITKEVQKRGRAELRTGWEEGMVVRHPKYGQCLVDKIHERTVKVTLKPIKNGKKFVVNAYQLGEWSSAQSNG